VVAGGEAGRVGRGDRQDPRGRECKCHLHPGASRRPLVSGNALRRNVNRFRGGLVFKAHRLLYHSTLGWRVIKKKKKKKKKGNALCFRAALVCKAVYHSALGSRVIQKKRTGVRRSNTEDEGPRVVRLAGSGVVEPARTGPLRNSARPLKWSPAAERAENNLNRFLLSPWK